MHANRLQLFDIIRVVKEIILEHRNDEFYVNVASGSKIHAIGCMMACMVFDDRKTFIRFIHRQKNILHTKTTNSKPMESRKFTDCRHTNYLLQTKT